MSSQCITPALRQWIGEQAAQGLSAQAMLVAMQASGWDPEVAELALTEAGHVVAPVVLTCPQHLPTLSGALGAHALWAGDRLVHVQASLNAPCLAVLGDFLSAQECEALVADALPRLSRSETVVNQTGGSEVNAARTSQGMFFSRGETPLCQRIEARIAALLNWPIEHGEGIQVLRYAPGAEYKPHYDYFDPEHPGSSPILRRGGQRVATLIMYLNTPQAGGGTTFPDIGLTVSPLKGQAVFFSYAEPHPSTLTLHGGAPVLQGEKWVATKWLRAGRFE